MNLADPAAPNRPPPRRVRRALLWGALLALLGVAQTLLVALTVHYESTSAQDAVETVAAESAAEVRSELLHAMQGLQALAWTEAPQPGWREGAGALLRSRQELKRVEWRDLQGVVVDAVETPFVPHLFTQMARADLGADAELACKTTLRAAAPMFSHSYFVPPAARVLTLRARQTHPAWLTISIVDAGPGIAPEVAARLFTPFFTTRAEGMGLGLSLCRTVVEQHGGALDFGAAPGGRGTEFRFTLPAPAVAETGETPALPITA